ncbi:hypothetical protein LTR94_033778, partial [Friedmanniomyces endolithicus]
IPSREDVGGVRCIQLAIERDEFDVAVQSVQPLCSGRDLGPTEISFRENNLALQVRKRDVIEIEKP